MEYIILSDFVPKLSGQSSAKITLK